MRAFEPAWDPEFAHERVGRISEATGTLIRVTGLLAKIGELYALTNTDRSISLHAEVVGISGEDTLMMPLGELAGISSRMQVTYVSGSAGVAVGDGLLGRVINGLNQPLDGLGDLRLSEWAPLYGHAPLPFERTCIEAPLPTGVKAIDALLTLGLGQRMGVFAPAGGGKSTLLGMLTRGADSDVNVIVMVGERGREIREFMEDNLDAKALAKTVMVVSTADRPAMERCRAVLSGIAIAEHFRDKGKNVLLLMDSVTRYARALREVGLAVGEPTTGKGFPPSVYAALPRLFERAGSNHRGTITSFFTVLLEDDRPGQDPIGEEVRSLLDGHIILSSKLAAKSHYPAIDVLRSTSRTMSRVTQPSHALWAKKTRQLLARYEEMELLIQLGEYQPGLDSLTDEAVRLNPQISQFLQQTTSGLLSWNACLQSLQALFEVPAHAST